MVNSTQERNPTFAARIWCWLCCRGQEARAGFRASLSCEATHGGSVLRTSAARPDDLQLTGVSGEGKSLTAPLHQG